jgi:hypothetical protein
MKNKILLFIALMFTAGLSNAQKNVYFTITNKLGSSNFGYGQVAQNDLMQNFKISRVEYYISGIKIIHDGGTETSVPSHYILAKGSSNVTDLLGNFNITNLEGVKFSVGVEAPTNNSDPTLFIAPHPLAPQSPSMHWGWTSGYRFVALEGTAGTNFNTTYEMHGLGNANYFEQTIMTNGTANGNDMFINIVGDYTKALKGISVNAGPIDHGVNATDLTVIQNFRDEVFTAGTSAPASIQESNLQNNITLFPNPTNNKVYFSNLNSDKQCVCVVIDTYGRVCEMLSLDNQNSIDLTNYTKGLYVLKLTDHQQKIVSINKITVQ